MTIALIASIIIIQRQMSFIRDASLGFNSKAVITVDYNGDQGVSRNYYSIRNELKKNPHIINVSRHDQNLVGGLGNGWTTTINLKGEEISTSLYRLNVDPEFFETYDIQLAAGRFPEPENKLDSTTGVIVNEAAVKTFGWELAENAIGKPFGRGENQKTVIGVVKDFNFENLHKPVEALYIGRVRGGNSLSLRVDAGHIDEIIDHLNTVWKEQAPDVPLRYSFVDESIARQYGSEQKLGRIFYVFSALSLLIGCLGLLGLAMFIVQQRTKEIGIRKVLGADVARILVMLTTEFAQLVLIASLIATPIAWYFSTTWLSGFAYHTTIAWWIFVVAGTLALLVAVLTVGIHAFRAAMVNPVKSLRVE
jgi:putative ABC transport system permease protein